MTNRALLIVDVQKGFINDHTEHIPALVEKLQHDYDHVFASQFINSENSPYERWLEWGKFMPGTEDVELAFEPKEGVVPIPKYKYSCVDEEFLGCLAKLDVDEVHICGIDTDICVTTCAVDLFQDGRFRPVVLASYCASHAGKDLHDNALEILPRYIGRPQIEN